MSDKKIKVVAISDIHGHLPKNLPEGDVLCIAGDILPLDVQNNDIKSATGWSMGWKVNLWARAQDGDHAHIIIKNALRHAGGNGGVYYNLFDAHPPFQIDGNFGVCAGIAEMLLQSAHGYINILPAMPTVWKKQGSVTGMKAIGNFAVDFNWVDGKCQKATITSNAGAELKVRCKVGAMELAKARITVDGKEVGVTVDELGVV